MNTNFTVTGLTRHEIKPESTRTAPEADALTTRPSELFLKIKKVAFFSVVTSKRSEYRFIELK